MSITDYCVEKARGLIDPGGKQQLVAFVFRKGVLVATGRNSYTKTHPWQARLAKLVGYPKKQFLHAEIAALLKSPRDADQIVVVRLRNGLPVKADPCVICQEAIQLFGIKNVVST